MPANNELAGPPCTWCDGTGRQGERRQLHGCSQEAWDELLFAYKRMAAEARYRPAAPSDGFGNITEPLDRLDLDTEAEQYAQRWRLDEDTCWHWIGTSDLSTVTEVVFAIEAARLLCGCDRTTALRLLEMAAEGLRAKGPSGLEGLWRSPS